MTQKFMKLLLLVSCMVPMAVSAKSDCSKSACSKPAPTKQHKRSVAAMNDAALADQAVDDTATRKSFHDVAVNGDLDVSGQTMLRNLIVDGSESVSGDLGVDGRLFVEAINGVVNLTGSLSVNGIPLSSPTGGPALYQYAQFSNLAGGQVLSGLSATTTDIVYFDTPNTLNTSGITQTVSGAGATQHSTIKIAVAGTYLVQYQVCADVGTLQQPLTFAVFGGPVDPAATLIPGSEFGINPTPTAADTQPTQVTGQFIMTVPAVVGVAAISSTNPYFLQLVGTNCSTVAAHQYTLETPAAPTTPVTPGLSAASITVIKIA